MSQSASDPGGTPPFGTQRRIRDRAIWAVALYAASVPPAIVGFGVTQSGVDEANVATPLAFALWGLAMLFAVWAAVPTMRYWDLLPATTRWLGALPLLCVSLFLSAAILLTTFA